MGNCCCTAAVPAAGSVGGRRRRRGESSSRRHRGIKTVDVEEYHCEFSSGDQKSDICICVVTWNMNGQVCYEDLAELVGSHNAKERKYELLVVGLQEAPRRNIARLLQAALANTHMLLGKAIMQSLQLYVFGPCRSSELLLTEVEVDKRSVGGCGGMARRKKGAVAIRINYKGISMVFISCHLAAHAGKVKERNWESKDITHSLFSKNSNPYSRPAHLTVWLGDLNYRIQGIDNFPVRKLIHNDLQSMLTGNDQLLQEAERGRVFDGFCEGTLTFKPTYKYDTGSSNYDTSHKVRVPSWTDRILFKIEERDEKMSANLHSYESVDGIDSSDHKPVRAHLCLRLTDDK
ncbi:unnamed protein product [Linum tenue]|uniref:Inositol polyphosphate-related phosphatase domain-containing protein n=1 Tax=Linum tenue TaxID=586396 RepID=A0AAV0P3V0_9ROSI|nr:unnamed protein product [Linum tenue]